MTEEEQDYLAVKIKHHGQCPYEKGHGYEFYAFLGGIAFATMFWIFIIISYGPHK